MCQDTASNGEGHHDILNSAPPPGFIFAGMKEYLVRSSLYPP